jgi:putative membrane protein
MMNASLNGIAPFLLYFSTGAALTVIFALLYMGATRHDEVALIRQGNTAAALAFGGSLLGFAIPLDKAIAQAGSLLDAVIWAILALIVQLIVYSVVRILIPKLSEEIEKNNKAVALFLAFVAITSGMLNAAAMTLSPA